MLQTSEVETDHLIRALRVYVNDLTDKYSPFNKGEEYLRDLSIWIVCAAVRLEQLTSEPHGAFK